jgi:hypothetical protein
MKSRTQFKAVTIVLLVAGCCQVFAQGSRKSVADREIPVMKVTRANATRCIYDLAHIYKIPVGFGASLTNLIDEDEVGPVIEARTVREVLNAAVVFLPEFSWSEIDGVIDISPSGAPDSLLDAMVDNLQVKDKTVNEIKLMICDMPEVKEAVKNSGSEITEELTTSWSVIPKNQPKYSFTFHKMTVREIMNQLLRKTDTKYWDVIRARDPYRWVYISVGT